ncbi:NAD(P)H-hydrate dehydratase [Vibrio sp. SCSIO 43136]|uniref:NAD(P)H-hydrate dehydratase n=1 Tax=Vibrio sp. SCSIO 43136 TaxID=2819101 RepID=UPI002075B9A1|nr:NAD(P)H-hydrate dehydratase [Vibrio sp. SCSIO 43136]USD68248.1 NAD(P)H-hydrate dehydratase [Vibrio sp. SCSIO 43136]
MNSSPLPPSLFPSSLYSAEAVRQGEQLAARTQSIPMYQLMERAGEAVFQYARQHHPEANHWLVCCGGGNNGGDGYVVARLAKHAGVEVKLWHVGDPSKLTGDAAIARDAWLKAEGDIAEVEELIPPKTELIIDAILGTGLNGQIRAAQQQLIEAVNLAEVPVVSVDVPSGLCANTGVSLGQAILAHSTVTFIGVKQGLVTGQAAQFVGELCFAGLGVDDTFSTQQASQISVISEHLVAKYLGPRKRTAHKGDHGKVTCIGGDSGMAGAIRLASEACLRVGAGLTAVLTQPDNVSAIVTARPEVMAKGWQEDQTALQNQCEWSDVLVLGPGLGQNTWGHSLFKDVIHSQKPMVLDADGLNWLAKAPNTHSQRIITPHPGEAARLLGTSIAKVEANRYQAVRALQQKYGGVVVLKGAGTLVDDGSHCYVCRAGNPGMATGGMGDVLSGVIGGLLAQKLSLIEAATLGVWLHSHAADRCAQQHGERGLLASDLFDEIRRLVNSYQ